MARRLARTVVLPQGSRNMVFTPDDDVPDWAAARITNPAAWASEPDSEPTPARRDAPPARKPEPEPTVEPVDADEPDEVGQPDIPPKAGPGASTEAWAAYAEQNHVEVIEGMSRKDIITALENAEVRTE